MAGRIGRSRTCHLVIALAMGALGGCQGGEPASEPADPALGKHAPASGAPESGTRPEADVIDVRGGAAGDTISPAAGPELTRWDTCAELARHLAGASGKAGADRVALIRSMGVVPVIRESGSVRPTRALFDVALDVPLPVVSGRAVGERPRCVLYAGEARGLEPTRERSIGSVPVASEFRRETVTEYNPEYEVARARVQEAKKREPGGNADWIATGDPAFDLIGGALNAFLDGYDAGDRDIAFEDALAGLHKTPRTRERAAWEPYHFERTRVWTLKRGAIPVALLDRQTGAYQVVELPVTEERALDVYDGLDPRDRSYMQRRAEGMTREQFAAWRERPARIAATELLAALGSSALPQQRGGEREVLSALANLGGTPSVATAADPETMPARKVSARETPVPRAKTSTAPAGHKSLVRVLGPGIEAVGFYVGPELIVTVGAVAGGTPLVDVRTADGLTVPGLIERRDVARDLALIKVPRPGSPVALDITADAPRPGVDDLRPGEPAFLDGKVVGMAVSSATGADPFVPSRELRAFIDGT